jgi:hypothetical protein
MYCQDSRGKIFDVDIGSSLEEMSCEKEGWVKE